MKSKNKNIRFWAGVPPWIFIGAAIVLLPIFAFITFENINRQKANSTRLLLEKGAALIRSFEAGTRTGLMGDYFSARQLQNLLAETALQQDIVYLLVVDANGIVLAHNDRSQIGKLYGRELSLKHISRSRNLKWRLLQRPDGKKIFEVVRRFSPTGGDTARNNALKMFRQLRKPHILNWQDMNPFSCVIFIGLDMEPIEEARRADVRHAVIMTGTMLFIGLAGIILLFLAHNFRAARTSLSRIKAFSDNLVDNMPIGLIALDIEKKIASYNHVAQKVFYLSDMDAVGKDMAEILPEELCDIIDSPEINNSSVEKEVDCMLDDGRKLMLEISATLLNDEDDNFLGYVLLLKDLAEVRALKKEVARSQRLATVGRLAGGVAHEIRNPLSSIKGFATYFKERYRSVPEDQETADIMIQEIDRLNRVVGQLLEFAKPVVVLKENTDISSLIRDSLKLVEKQAKEKSIKIQTNNSEVVKGTVDTDRLSQVMLNLYLNAIESMEDGGTLSVDLLNDDEENRIMIKVSDTGKGIDNKCLQNIFDPYYTTKPAGTGIGLAVVHNIVDAHNGEIKVESKPGQGSVFTVSFPDMS